MGAGQGLHISNAHQGNGARLTTGEAVSTQDQRCICQAPLKAIRRSTAVRCRKARAATRSSPTLAAGMGQSAAAGPQKGTGKGG